MANVLEVLVVNSFLEIALGFFFGRQLAKFRPKKKKKGYDKKGWV